MQGDTPVELHLVCGNRNYSSWSLRAWLCLRRAGYAPAVTVLPMDTPEFEARITGLSPTRRVPVLWIGRECVWDSLAIAETVNERLAAGRLWPEDTALRALGRSMAAEMHSGFRALREALPMNCQAEQRSVAIDEAVTCDIARVCEIWDTARATAQADRWLLGDWSIADAMFAPVVLRFRAYRLPLPESAQQYVTHWLQDPHLAEWIAEAKRESWVIDHEEVGGPVP